MRCALLYCIASVCLSSSAVADQHGRPASKLPPITALALTPDGNQVVVGSQAGLELKALPNFELIAKLPSELAHIHDISFSPDGRFLAVVGGSPSEFGSIEMFNWPDTSLRNRLQLYDDVNYALAWHSDSKTYAVGGADTRISLYQLDSDSPVRVIEGHSRSVLTVAFLPDGNGLVSGGVDESIRLWEEGSGELMRTLSNHSKPVVGLATRPGDWPGPVVIASIGLDQTVRLWQPTIGRLMRFARLPSPPLDVRWLGDGKYIAVACKDGALRILDPDTMEALQELPALDGIAYCLGAAPDGSVVLGGQYGQLAIRKPQLQ